MDRHCGATSARWWGPPPVASASTDVMNQLCRVCGEPAAGFHFGAFTCEGCKSFFGRTYNNLSSISECKNNNECIINKKNRTSCKSCRLRKCLMVGMSKSGSRYGRRSNWFKIHCLLQEQQQAQQQSLQNQQQHQQLTTPSRLNFDKDDTSDSLKTKEMLTSSLLYPNDFWTRQNSNFLSFPSPTHLSFLSPNPFLSPVSPLISSHQQLQNTFLFPFLNSIPSPSSSITPNRLITPSSPSSSSSISSSPIVVTNVPDTKKSDNIPPVVHRSPIPTTVSNSSPQSPPRRPPSTPSTPNTTVQDVAIDLSIKNNSQNNNLDFRFSKLSQSSFNRRNSSDNDRTIQSSPRNHSSNERINSFNERLSLLNEINNSSNSRHSISIRNFSNSSRRSSNSNNNSFRRSSNNSDDERSIHSRTSGDESRGDVSGEEEINISFVSNNVILDNTTKNNNNNNNIHDNNKSNNKTPLDLTCGKT